MSSESILPVPSETTVASGTAAPSGHRERFLANVLWNWASTGVTIVTSLIVAPMLIRRLGDEQYGLWALTVSLAEYYWIVDLGFRSATVKFSAHYRALGRPDKINEIVNTALFYSCCAGIVMLAVNLAVAPHLATLMNIKHPLFPKLIMLVLGAWIVGSLFNVFFSCLEGFQRFDVLTKINVIGATLRTVGTITALLLGYGVLEIAIITLAVQAINHFLSFLSFRNIFEEHAFGRRFVRVSVLREMFSYGTHSLLASIGTRILSQCAPLVIASALPTRFVGYYSAPNRLLEYSVDGITRIGAVSSPNAAEMVARGERSRLVQLSVITNRYSLALFLPLAIFLSVYSYQLLSVWIKPDFAAEAYGVMLALLTSTTVALAGQFASSSILFGMGRHQVYSRGLIAEAVISVAGLLVIVPRYGIQGAAWLMAATMILNRGFFTAWLLSKELEVSYSWFLRKIYSPLPLAIPAVLVLRAAQVSFLPGKNWPELIAAGCLGSLCYLPLAWFAVEPPHREVLLGRLRSLTGRRKG